MNYKVGSDIRLDIHTSRPIRLWITKTTDFTK